MTRRDSWMKTRSILAWATLVVLASAVRAGGSPEESMLLIDPSRADSMYIANYYMHARDIPGVNALYMDPTAVDYWTFVDENLPGLFGDIANKGIRDHIDYITVAPADSFYIDAPGLVACSCPVVVTRFSISAVYTMSIHTAAILGGNMASHRPNRYFGLDNAAWGFDSNTRWYLGEPSPDSGQYYTLGAYLGYTGQLGNTVAEILDMIDRSVAVDGTRPTGTYYYMQTEDIRSTPRHGYYPTAVTDMAGLGGAAEHLYAVLPTGRHDCLGIMTGLASPNIDGEDMTILPGAICDHLTSWAATFDISSQVKLSRWIVAGASGSWGTVEEPCAIAGKFPHARAFIYYQQGLSLGEAYFRSAEYLPFQGLLYGDPLTRPFAYLPTVDVSDAPAGPVSGVITLTPTATTAHPTAQIEAFRLLVDGVTRGLAAPAEQFTLDTETLSDGWHDLRVLVYDDTTQRFTGRWIGSLTTNNRGRTATLSFPEAAGNLSTKHDFSIDVGGAGVLEERLIHNGRVVAIDENVPPGSVVHGLMLGAGPVRVTPEVLYDDGERVRGEPVELEIAYEAGVPSGEPPSAYSFTKYVLPSETFVVELPATFDDMNTPLSYELLTSPPQATVVPGSGAYRVMTPNEGATGTDEFTFQVHSAAGDSNVATVTLVYYACLGDFDGNHRVDLADLANLLSFYGMTSGAVYTDGDMDGDEDVDLADLAELLSNYGDICY